MKALGIIIVLLIIIGGAWYFFSNQAAAPGTEDAENGEVTTMVPADPQLSNVTVTYTDDGFNSNEVTIPVGATVTWVNNSSEDMWVASAQHPTHAVYDGTNLSAHCVDGVATSDDVFDACAGIPTGESWSFTFDKEGQWFFHDHLNVSHFGSVTVEAVEEMTVN